MRPQALRKNTALLVAGLFVLVAGLWLDVKWLPHRVTIEFYTINLVPGLALLLTWYLASKALSRPGLLIGLGVGASVLTAAYALLLNLGAAFFTSATTPVTDVSRYEAVRTYYAPHLVAHFPHEIPPNATRVTLFYLPHFLQGGSYLQLRYRLPGPEVLALFNQYQPLAQQIQTSAGDILHTVDVQGQLPVPPFRNEANSDFAALPDDFVVLVLEAQSIQPADWNHGDSFGLAVSLERQEIIYWAQYW